MYASFHLRPRRHSLGTTADHPSAACVILLLTTLLPLMLSLPWRWAFLMLALLAPCPVATCVLAASVMFLTSLFVNNHMRMLWTKPADTQLDALRAPHK